MIKRIQNWQQARANKKRWYQYFATHLKVNPAGAFYFPDGGEGAPMPNPNDPDVTSQAPNVEAWAYIACQVLGKNLSAAPLVVERRESEGGIATWVRDDGGPLYDLITRPNPNEPMDVLLWRIVLSLMAGDCYLTFDKASNEIYHLHSKYVKVKADRDQILGYVVERDGKKATLEPDEVIHLRMPNINHEFYGASPVEPVKISILTNYWYRRHIKDFFRTGAVPGGLLSSDQAVSGQTAEETRKEWNKTHGGPGKGHRIGIVGAGLSYQQITSPISELLNEALSGMTREEILGVFGCPPVFAGVFQYANYANSKEQKQFLWENTILPLMRIIVGYLNIRLAPQYGDRIRLAFDISKIKALQEDETEQTKREVIAVKGGIRTPNEARQRLGDEPSDDPMADELQLMGPMELFEPKPVEGEGAKSDLMKSTEWIPELLDTTKAPKSPISDRLNRSSGHEAAITYQSRLYASELRKFFDGQLDRVLSNIDQIGIKGKIPTANLFAMIHELKGPEDDISLIMDVDAENILLAEITDPVIRQMIVQSAMAGAAEIGASFNISNPLVPTTSEQFKEIVKNINRHTYDDILRVLREGYEKQWTLSDVEKALRGKYQEYYKNRSLTIARTETNGMVNAGHLMAYKDGGVEQIKWQSAFLPLSRIHHMQAHGQTVLTGQKFQIGGDLLRFPGDPNAHVGNRVNCHCRVGIAVKG